MAEGRGRLRGMAAEGTGSLLRGRRRQTDSLRRPGPRWLLLSLPPFLPSFPPPPRSGSRGGRGPRPYLKGRRRLPGWPQPHRHRLQPAAQVRPGRHGSGPAPSPCGDWLSAPKPLFGWTEGGTRGRAGAQALWRLRAAARERELAWHWRGAAILWRSLHQRRWCGAGPLAAEALGGEGSSASLCTRGMRLPLARGWAKAMWLPPWVAP